MKQISLNEDWRLWQLTGQETGGQVFRISSLPCQVEDALLENGVIENPNLRGINNDRWIGANDWCYEKIFSVEDTETEWNLILEGLDTYADIYLNEKLLAQNESVYMPCRIEGVCGLKAGENVLRLIFKAPERILKQAVIAEECEPFVPHFCRGRVFRSGFHEFSGPLPDLIRIGVYGNIYLEKVEENGFRSVDLTVEVDPQLVKGRISVESECYHSCGQGEKVHYVLRDECGETVLKGCAPAGKRLEVTVERPMLWWPRSHGRQNLYEWEMTLLRGEKVLDCRKSTIGFRRLEKKGDFDFWINGHALKLWGGNLAQVDTISGCYHKKKMQELLNLAELAHFNCLRVWGESEILPDEFYEECDRRGILLWHDFYLGFHMYSEEETMLALYQREAQELVKRLKHHPSILLWCGGNEVPLSRDFQFPGQYCYGEPVYMQLYKEVCRRLDPGRYYHPNSPFGGAYANDPAEGDTHGYTHQWYVPNAAYPVFLSENCRVSTPALRTMKRMMSPEELWPDGYSGRNSRKVRLPWPASWQNHNSNQGAVKLGPVEHYYDAENIEELIYNIGAAHCEYIKKDVERFRRGKPGTEGERRTKGHILWKFNNCSNMISYGVVDYFNEPQMAYYALKRAYEPFQVSFQIEDRISVWLVNDTMAEKSGSVEIALFSLSQNKITQRIRREFDILPDESKRITFLDAFGQFRREQVLLASVRDEEGRLLAENLDYVDIERHLVFPESTGIQAEIEGDALVLTTQRFARCIELTGSEDGDEFGWLFEDNYFDLVPGTKKCIRILGRHKKGRITVRPYYEERALEIAYTGGIAREQGEKA